MQPWDPPPAPTKGDDSAGLTFEWAGRFMSQWEHVEFRLSLLYSTFTGHSNSAEKVQEYGLGKIFRERLQNLRRCASKFFIANSDQELEAVFQHICVATEGFSERRNEIAHAVVFPSIFLPSFIEDRIGNHDRWALAPPYYAVRNFNPEGLPKYAYTSRELNQLVIRLNVLQKDIEVFQETLQNTAS